MSIEQMIAQTLKIIDRYEQFLTQVKEQDFQVNPAAGVWSYSEVFSHIFSANHACLIAIQNCVQGKAIESREPASISGRLILFFGIFLPVKIKAPERIAAMVKKITKEEAQIELQKFRENLMELVPKMEQASPTQKAKHPRLGLFNVRQWLRFIQIHTLHHEKQLYRVKGMLEKSR